VEAAHLFVERARASRVSFEVPAVLEPLLADICQQLDSMPLAIELAAVRARALGLEQIAARLGDRFQLLSRGSEPGPARHRTLRAAMEWSYDLLNSEEKSFFSRLSVFAGGWTLDAAEEVCGEPGSSVLDVLERLVERSLVIVEERNGLVRYSMLETLRQFSAARLAESGAEAQLHERQRAWCCRLATDAARGVWRADQLVWLERLRRERDNIRAALGWTLSGACDPDPGLRLAAAMVRFWNLTGELQEGAEWLTALLALPHVEQHSVARAQAITALGYLAIMRGDQPRAIALLDPALAFWRGVGEPQVVAVAVFFRAMASGWYELAGQREFMDLTHEALALARIRGPRWVEYLALLALGEAARMSGDVARAEALLTDGLALAREAGERWGSYLGLVGLGLLALSQGQIQRAGESVREALRMARELDDPRAQAYVLEARASIAVRDRSPFAAVQLFGAAERHRRPLGELMLVSWRADRERGLAAARAALSQNAFADAWSAGQLMSLDEAVDFALQNSKPPRSGAHDLTPRELEVLRLVALGRTNREIGEALVVSHRTVKRHMDNIFAKFTVSSRTAAAAAALRAGLV
jgi:non-specific serine/threonine protein kinase